MFKNYITVAIRNLARNKAYTFINVIGLAIGLTCSTLILLYLQNEFSYDRHHSKADRIYKIFQSERLSSGKMTYHYGIQGPAAPAMAKELPEIERATRFINRAVQVGTEGKESLRKRVTVADREFFKIFDFPLHEGNTQTGLQQPFSIFITQSLAQSLFGNESPIGKTIKITSKLFDDHYTITGILKDAPENSTKELAPELITMTLPNKNPERMIETWENWDGWGGIGIARTYLLLKTNVAQSNLKKKLPGFRMQHLSNKTTKAKSYELLPLTDLYFQGYQKYRLPSTNNGNLNTCYALGWTGFFIVIIACINFMNLSTARSVRRMREVGLRKVVGAKRTQLIHQFLGESVLLAIFSLMLALGLTELALPILNGFMQINLSINPQLLLFCLILTIGVGLLAGSYPALFLSAFRPTTVLKIIPNTKGRHAVVRKGLVVIQFAISMVLIVATLVVYLQTEHMLNADNGFQSDTMVWIAGISGSGNLPQVIKRELLSQPSVSHVSISHAYPIENRENPDRDLVSTQKMDSPIAIRHLVVDHDFLKTYQIPLLSGRDFMPEDHRPWDENKRPDDLKVLLSETAAVQLQVQSGDRIEFADGSHEVVGIFKDFHNRPLQQIIDPMMLMCSFHPQQATMSLRIDTQNLPEVMTHIQAAWEKTFPTRSFSPFFSDNVQQYYYGSELKQRSLYAMSSILAIAIACLGLLGLIAYTAEVRTKEIGIRKVLGATDTSIVSLLTKEFLILVSLASLLAWPIAYYTMDDWLQSFAYRINLSPVYFITSTGTALIITLITIAYQALKAARANPVEALRYE